MNFLEIFFTSLYILFALIFIGAIIYFIYEKVSGKEKENFEDREN